MNSLVEGDAMLQSQAQKQPAGQRVSSRRRTEASIPTVSSAGWTQETLDVPAGAPQPQRRADDIVVACDSSNSASNVQPQQSSMASPSAGCHLSALRLELVFSVRDGSSSSSSTLQSATTAAIRLQRALQSVPVLLLAAPDASTAREERAELEAEAEERVDSSSRWAQAARSRSLARSCSHAASASPMQRPVSAGTSCLDSRSRSLNFNLRNSSTRALAALAAQIQR